MLSLHNLGSTIPQNIIGIKANMNNDLLLQQPYDSSHIFPVELYLKHGIGQVYVIVHFIYIDFLALLAAREGYVMKTHNDIHLVNTMF